MAFHKLSKQELNDIVEWDIVNWSKAINYWEQHIDFVQESPARCLELGGRQGGLSLYMALKGMDLVCSDLENPRSAASKLHSKYKGLTIDYEAINALAIPYENEFDFIVFKSILGGISGNGNNHFKKETLVQIHKALKPGGKLLFTENLEASMLHQYLRKRFIRWGNRWNYLNLNELEGVFESFESFEYSTAGFFGTFGRTEKQRRLLGRIDTIVEKVVPSKYRYLVFGFAVK